VHYEALRNYLDYIDDRYFMNSVRAKKIKIDSISPVGKFACGDQVINKAITELVRQLKSSGTQKARTLILIYGPSSVGKTYLVEQLFAGFGQDKKSFAERHLICTQKLDAVDAIASLVKKAKTSPSPRPFIFVDEADVKMKVSIFPSLLKLRDEGKLDVAGTELDSFVLFWGGSSHGTLKSLQDFLERQKKSRSFQKGIDVFNRSTRIELPARLMQNRSHKVALGLARVTEAFPPPVWVNWNVVEALRKLTLIGGARDLQDFPNRLKKTRHTVRLIGEAPSRRRFQILG
jgi:predicted AAA+ superfamily ATPase